MSLFQVFPGPFKQLHLTFHCMCDSQMSLPFTQVLLDSSDGNGPLGVSSELTQLSGVAAILRFPIADLSEPEDLSSSDED